MQTGFLVLNFSLMIILPLALGWWLSRKRSVSWRLFAIGCGTFVISQLGHLPFNTVVLPRLTEQIDHLSTAKTLLITALFLGLSAALFEEGARFIGYRFWAKDARSWGKGMMLGAGHGGIESILLGTLVGVNTLLLIAWRNDQLLGIMPSGQETIITQTVDSLTSIPWYAAMLGALERFFTISIHLALSLMIMLAIVRSRPLWIATAIFWHTLVDAVAVISASTWGAYRTELLIGLMALVSLVFVLRLREPESTSKALPPLEPPEPIGRLQMDVTRDNLDNSRYSS